MAERDELNQGSMKPMQTSDRVRKEMLPEPSKDCEAQPSVFGYVHKTLAALREAEDILDSISRRLRTGPPESDCMDKENSKESLENLLERTLERARRVARATNELAGIIGEP